MTSHKTPETDPPKAKESLHERFERERAARRRARRTGRLRGLRRGRCRICGCTDNDCSQCVEASGAPCSWVDAAQTLCTRCGGRP